MSRRSRLEAALLDSFDVDGLSVYADLLLEQDDPRGEWLSLEVAVARGNAEPAVVAPHRQAAVNQHALGIAEVTWSHGFFDTVRVESLWNITRLLQHPLALRVRRVELTRWTTEDDDGDRALAALKAAAAQPGLEQIVFRGWEVQVPDEVVATLLSKGLTELTLDASLSAEALGRVAAAGVATLGVRWGPTADAFTWRGVEELVLFGEEEPAALERLIRGDALPEVKKLAVLAPLEHETCSRLLTSPWIERLLALQVPRSRLSLVDDHRERLAHLQWFHRLDLWTRARDVSRIAIWFESHDLHAETVRAYRRALELEPHESVFWNNLGDALRFLQRPADALACFNKAMAFTTPDDSGWSIYLGNAGKAHIHLGQIERAVAVLERSVKFDPGNGSSQYDLACALALAGEPDRAMEHLRLALPLEPTFRAEAAEDSDFKSLRERPDFRTEIL